MDCDAAHCISPLGIHLLPQFVDAEEEAALVAAATRPGARWTPLSGRRVQQLGGLVHEKAGLLPAPLPSFLRPLLCRLQPLLGFEANHVLANAYAPGEGILPHQDGPLYTPVVGIVSLGAHTVFCFTPHARLGTPDTPPLRVYLPPRSCLVFQGAAYEDYLHGIEAVEEDDLSACANGDAWGGGTRRREGERISLTCRKVLKTRTGLLPGRN